MAEMTEARRHVLRRRYLSLGSGELVAAAVFAGVGHVTFGSRVDHDGLLGLWGGLAPLVVVLVQGGAYWLLARSWVGRRPMPHGPAGLYRAFRALDPVLLVAGAVVLATHLPDAVEVAVLAVLAWLFAMVEYLNYYIVRLAFPASRWLAGVRERRTPRLVLDLRAARG